MIINLIGDPLTQLTLMSVRLKQTSHFTLLYQPDSYSTDMSVYQYVIYQVMNQ